MAKVITETQEQAFLRQLNPSPLWNSSFDEYPFYFPGNASALTRMNVNCVFSYVDPCYFMLPLLRQQPSRGENPTVGP